MDEFELTLEEGDFLIKLARRSIEHYLKHGKLPDEPLGLRDRLQARGGVFVSLYDVSGGAKTLRGCVGFPYPLYPIAIAAMKAAVAAATEDPRFEPVSLEELDGIIVEVSVLTPPKALNGKRPLDYPKLIKIGENGLIVEDGFRSGLLLPQVAVEWGWDPEEFLMHTCLKAGLPPDAWLSKNVKVKTFKAIVFSEESPKGPVKQVDLPSGL